jgi:glycosyltransferase involved in cell wall biosynthesis
MVTGAYYPEVSGGGLQCRQLVLALRDRTTFSVLTTTTESVSGEETLDGVPVIRVAAAAGRGSMLRAALEMIRAFFRLRHRFQIVHLHGFSRKTILLVILARLLRRRLVLKLGSVGMDDPVAVRARGWLDAWAYRQADLYICVSPRQEALYRATGSPSERFRLIPNGVDLGRFRPGEESERAALRVRLGLPAAAAVVLFVGFFSTEKRPNVLFAAWRRLTRPSVLVFVGATSGPYYEIDSSLAREMRDEAERRGVIERVRWVETTTEIEEWYRAADVFVLTSSREGLPNALLEAMASGLPCVASRLPGVTDTVIEHGTNGLLVDVDDVAGFANALDQVLGGPDDARRLGERARKTIEEGYSIERTAARVYEAYVALETRT